MVILKDVLSIVGLAGLLLLLLVVATPPPRTDGVTQDLKLLFEHDGCKIYRFSDKKVDHYYSDCRASSGKVEIK